MTYFIGIDPSINSTGICIQKFNEEEKISEDFIILKPGDKDIPESKWLTKKEKLAEEQLYNFQYCYKHDKMHQVHLHDCWFLVLYLALSSPSTNVIALQKYQLMH